MLGMSSNQQTTLFDLKQKEEHAYLDSSQHDRARNRLSDHDEPSASFSNKTIIKRSLNFNDNSTMETSRIIERATPTSAREYEQQSSTPTSDEQQQTITYDTTNEQREFPGHQFIFDKPVYNHHYHDTHYHHLERHDSFFHELKQLFKRNSNRLTSSNTGGTSTSHYSFGNEFNKDLEQRYGKWGTFAGKGSGGTVRTIRRATDNKVFAVKEFRKRRPQEPERDYVKKVTAEFCIGSALHHDNIIETLDIIQEGPSTFYEIMEYAPHDMFSVVMHTKMSPEEIGCYWRQLLNGVSYLQGMGIGHRDLKLDNLVIDEHNIVKIIDFGTATVVRYPFDKVERLTSGICGSDPYIAPEQYKQEEYSAFMADMWSCGIIFVCMVIRRFAWRIPRVSFDKNYQLYLSNRNSLLAYIPRYARPTIAHLLTPNPSHRCSMATLLSDRWVASIPTCTDATKTHQHSP